MSFDEKKYHIDNEPASARDIIKMARGLSEPFDNDWLQQTSVAAGILRENGHEVGKLEDMERL